MNTQFMCADSGVCRFVALVSLCVWCVPSVKYNIVVTHRMCNAVDSTNHNRSMCVTLIRLSAILHVANDVQQNTICCLWCNFSFVLPLTHTRATQKKTKTENNCEYANAMEVSEVQQYNDFWFSNK